MYIGNGAYCYANSTSMLLKAYGEEIHPSTIEVLTGVGLGATLEPNGMLFLNNCTTEPDSGITRALNTLGFTFTEKWSDDEAECPLKELREVLKTRPAIIGPLDMGYLEYIPNHMYAHGSDHFVLAYKLDEEFIYVQDPAGYPYSRLKTESFKTAWKAESIGYRRGAYRYWHSPKRVSSPSEDEVYARTISFFQDLYRQSQEIGSKRGAETGKGALLAFSNHLAKGEITGDLAGHMTYFLFQLGAKRANDFAEYFSKNHPKLAELKKEQSEILGSCHCLTVKKEWSALSKMILEFSNVEEQFEKELLSL